ncbi:MAG: 3-oxoacid CoA-transferase subunit A [Chloroflexota bacterium]
MIDKVVATVAGAIGDIPDGATIMVGGFSASGTPYNLMRALSLRGLKNVTLIGNAFSQFITCEDASWVGRVICSTPVPHAHAWGTSPVDRAIRDGKIEVEIVPQGTLVERIRAGGAGIMGFYTPTGAGTLVAEGKEKRVIDGMECLLELPLKADYALVKADKADRLGNLTYRMAQRNFNPLMASAARTTIAEVDEVVPPGALDPEAIGTPGIYVHRVVRVSRWQFPPRVKQG